MPDVVELRSSYFYLSYAHSPPLAGTPQVAHDRWVRTFFLDLTDAVGRLGSGRADIAPGFFDQELPLGSNWRAALVHALGSAEVFVPLYSPGYFTRSWPGREWACFERRLINAGLAAPLRRFAPVLWIPLPPGQDQPALAQALALGGDDSAYAENGLRALLRLAPYRDLYKRIVERLAAQIVELAERSPLTPSATPDFEEVQSPFCPETSAVVFVVAVAAGSSPGASSGGADGPHVTSHVAWRPFPEIQDVSLAEYAATVAEQLDFAVFVMDLDKAEAEFGRNPGVILIDPWYVADEKGLRELRRVVGRLPPWILPVLVVNPGADRREAGLAQQVRAILDRPRPARTETVAQAVAGITSLEKFVTLMPFLIAEAERRYLRGGPMTRPIIQPGVRPRLFGEWTAGPVGDAQKEDLDD
jgi:FxsC-like protein